MPVSADSTWDDTWDIFISGYNLSDRVKFAFQKVTVSEKIWLIFPEYGFNTTALPQAFDGCMIYGDDALPSWIDENGIDEAEYIILLMDRIDIKDKKICIDITGFLKPYMMTILKYFKENSIYSSLDIIFTEPVQYKKKENTKFSEDVMSVRQVRGLEGMHVPDTENDVLIIGAGYDHDLIQHIAQDKEHSRKISIYGFPPLRPDMYQQNILRASRAAEAIGRSSSSKEHDNYCAPANDPFVTANTINDIVNKINQKKPISNLYLSPLATKAQALGFTLYYLFKDTQIPTSMIYPFTRAHSDETSVGIARAWKYTCDFM